MNDPRRRATRLWRVAFIGYAATLTVATHWPSLELGTATSPAPDKILHMLAFGMLVPLLWHTRWFRRPWIVLAVATAWTVLDEITQATPGLGRTFTWLDVGAGLMGVGVAAVWWWALAPIGGAPNRARLAWQQHVLDAVLAEWTAWIAIGAAGAAGAALIGALEFGVSRLLRIDERYMLVTLLVATAGGGVAGMHAMLIALYRRQARRLAPEPMMQVSMTLRGAWRGVAAGALIVVAAILMYFVVVALSVRVTLGKQLVRTWNDLPLDMRLAIDFTLLMVALAVAARVFRRVQARLFDRQHERCRICRQDLSGLTLEHGAGRCPECGTPFADLGS